MNIKKSSIWAAVAYIIVKWAVMLTVGGVLIKQGLWRDEFFLIIPVIAITFLVIRHRRKVSKGEI